MSLPQPISNKKGVKLDTLYSSQTVNDKQAVVFEKEANGQIIDSNGNISIHNIGKFKPTTLNTSHISNFLNHINTILGTYQYPNNIETNQVNNLDNHIKSINCEDMNGTIPSSKVRDLEETVKAYDLSSLANNITDDRIDLNPLGSGQFAKNMNGKFSYVTPTANDISGLQTFINSTPVAFLTGIFPASRVQSFDERVKSNPLDQHVGNLDISRIDNAADFIKSQPLDQHNGNLTPARIDGFNNAVKDSAKELKVTDLQDQIPVSKIVTAELASFIQDTDINALTSDLDQYRVILDPSKSGKFVYNKDGRFDHKDIEKVDLPWFNEESKNVAKTVQKSEFPGQLQKSDISDFDTQVESKNLSQFQGDLNIDRVACNGIEEGSFVKVENNKLVQANVNSVINDALSSKELGSFLGRVDVENQIEYSNAPNGYMKIDSGALSLSNNISPYEVFPNGIQGSNLSPNITVQTSGNVRCAVLNANQISVLQQPGNIGSNIYKLTVNQLTNLSDRRLKDNFRVKWPESKYLERLMSVKPYTYTFKSDDKDTANTLRLGFIADELAEVYANYVTSKNTYMPGYKPEYEQDPNDFCSVDFTALTAYHILAFQEYVNKTDKRIAELEKKLADK